MSHPRSCLPVICMATACALLAGAPARAGEADVVGVTMRQAANGTYDFSVTVRHADEGWNHYADRWEILTPDRHPVAMRRLRHPHVDEQPVTRDLAAVRIPDGVTQVVVRAHDSRDGYGGREMTVRLDPPPLSTPPAPTTPAATSGDGS